MSQTVRVKDLYSALSEIQAWTETVKKALGSLDPQTVVPTDVDRCVAFGIPMPVPPPAPVVRDLCDPPMPGGPWSNPLPPTT